MPEHCLYTMVSGTAAPGCAGLCFEFAFGVSCRTLKPQHRQECLCYPALTEQFAEGEEQKSREHHGRGQSKYPSEQQVSHC